MIKSIALMTPGWPGTMTQNGIATSVYHLACGLRAAGYKPVILTYALDGKGPDDIPVIKIEEEPWRLGDRLRARRGNLEVVHNRVARCIADAIRRADKAFGVDVVLMEETQGWAGLVQDLVSQPVFATLHGPWLLLQSLVKATLDEGDALRVKREAEGYSKVTGLIAPSRNVLDAVRQAYPGLDTPGIVLPNTLPPGDIPRDRRNDILFIGRYDFLKGADTVLSAFAQLSEIHPGARLTFAGPDKGIAQEDGTILHADAAIAQLPENVQSQISYVGPLDRHGVTEARAHHGIALIASRYENLNYTMLEAMAAGQAIVSTKVGGPADVLSDGQTGLLVPASDATSMAKALSRLFADETFALQMGQAGHALLLQDFDPETIAVQTVAFMEETLASGSRVLGKP